MKMTRILLTLITVHFSLFTLFSQQPQAASSTTKRVLTAADTLPVYYSIVLAPERFIPLKDTLPDRNFRVYNPTRQQVIDWGNLGNLGSSARPLLYETMPRRGFDPGVHCFDLYHVQPEDLGFYRHARSFSDVFFSAGRNQFDGMLKAIFSRTFAGGTNFSLDYRSINNLGQFRYQRDKHNALAAGVWIPIGDQDQLFVIYSRNVNRQQENGGITTDTVFSRNVISGPISAPIYLQGLTATTRTDDQRFQITDYFNFTRAADSLSNRVFRASYGFEWNRQTYKFSDTSIQADHAYYENYNFLTDERGVRNYFDFTKISNQFNLATFKSKKAGRPSDNLTVGITHSFIKLHEETLDTTFSNLFLTGNLAITPSEAFGFTAQGSLGLLSNFGEYNLGGEMSVGLGKAGRLSLSLLSQRHPPDLLHARLYISDRKIWDNSFQKPVENVLSATYALPLLGIEVTGRTQLISNYLYYNQSSVATQTTSPLQIAQLIVKGNFRLWHMHLDNTIALQKSNRDDVLRLPTWFTQNSIYYSGNLFKKRLNLTLGMDFRMNSSFTPDGYQPLIWQFHLQDTFTQKPYIWYDLFMAFKIQSFRFFVRYENANLLFNLFEKNALLYQTASYLQPFNSLRLGIAWRFMDFNTGPANPNSPSKGNTSGRPGSRGF
jgi:hypothetical protein